MDIVSVFWPSAFPNDLWPLLPHLCCLTGPWFPVRKIWRLSGMHFLPSWVTPPPGIQPPDLKLLLSFLPRVWVCPHANWTRSWPWYSRIPKAGMKSSSKLWPSFHTCKKNMWGPMACESSLIFFIVTFQMPRTALWFQLEQKHTQTAIEIDEGIASPLNHQHNICISNDEVSVLPPAFWTSWPQKCWDWSRPLSELHLQASSVLSDRA